MAPMDVKAALAAVGAQDLRKAARELGVDTSFYLPGKGTRYLKSETIFARIAERVSKGLIKSDVFDAVKVKYSAPGVPAPVKMERKGDPVAPQELFEKHGEFAGGFKEIETGGAQVVTEHGTEKEIPKGKTESGAPAPGAAGGEEGEGDEGAEGDESESETKGKGKAKPKGGDDKEHPLLKELREYIEEKTGAKPGDEKAPKPRVVTHRVEVKGEVKGEVSGVVHEAFDEVLECAMAGVPVFMVGPAGTGKTHLAGSVAKALSREFVFDSFSPGVGEGKLEGRLLPIEAGGKFAYVSSKFVDAYEQGWCYLADECDNADPSTLSILNAALANGHMSVPSRTENRVATRSALFIFMAAANTYGNGGDRIYVGRNQLDGATLDRFRIGTVDVKYDKKLEASIHVKLPSGESVGAIPQEILAWGWAMRDVIRDHKLRRICSMRNMINAAQRQAVGGKPEKWRKSFFSDWSVDDMAKVPANLK